LIGYKLIRFKKLQEESARPWEPSSG